MGTKKIISLLKEKNAIDERNIFCFNNARVTVTSNKLLYLKQTTYSSDIVPGFMVVSLCENTLYIFKASMMGRPKELFTAVNISDMYFVGKTSKDFISIYHYKICYGADQYQDFYIQGVKHKKNMEMISQIIFNNQR